MDPNADPTPAELAEWRAADLAVAQEWAAGRLEKARRHGDVEIVQHLGNLVAASARVAELETQKEQIEQLVSEEEGQTWTDPRLTPHFVRKLRAIIDGLSIQPPR